MANEVTLLDFWASPFGMRVRMALAFKSIQYEYKEENLMVEKSPLLLQMNPIHKKIPVLIHNGKPIFESLIVVQYIDEVWTNQKAQLLPSDPYGRVQARFWADYVDKKVFDTGIKVLYSKGEEHEKGKQEFLEVFKTLEGQLGERKYFGGESLGFVDVALLPFYSWFHAFEKCGGFGFGSEFPKIMSWAERCVDENTNVGQVLPDQEKVYEFISTTLRKKFGVE